jgi:hypothetical protein
MMRTRRVKGHGQPNGEYDFYNDYRIHFPNGEKSKSLELWTGTEQYFYLTPSGKGYLILNYIDGGWAIFLNHEEYTFSWQKPWVKRTKDKLVIVYTEKSGEVVRLEMK